jgi:hypothetical protein
MMVGYLRQVLASIAALSFFATSAFARPTLTILCEPLLWTQFLATGPTADIDSIVHVYLDILSEVPIGQIPADELERIRESRDWFRLPNKNGPKRTVQQGLTRLGTWVNLELSDEDKERLSTSLGRALDRMIRERRGDRRQRDQAIERNEAIFETLALSGVIPTEGIELPEREEGYLHSISSANAVYRASPDGKRLITRLGDGSLQLWNLLSLSSSHHISSLDDSIITFFAFSDHGKGLVIGSKNGTVEALAFSQSAGRGMATVGGPVRMVRLLPDGLHLVALHENAQGELEASFWNYGLWSSGQMVEGPFQTQRSYFEHPTGAFIGMSASIQLMKFKFDNSAGGGLPVFPDRRVIKYPTLRPTAQPKNFHIDNCLEVVESPQGFLFRKYQIDWVLLSALKNPAVLHLGEGGRIGFSAMAPNAIAWQPTTGQFESWNLETFTASPLRLQKISYGIRPEAIAVSSDGELIAVSFPGEKEISIFRSGTGNILYKAEALGEVRHLEFASDSNSLLGQMHFDEGMPKIGVWRIPH